MAVFDEPYGWMMLQPVEGSSAQNSYWSNVYTQVLEASVRAAVDRIGGELITIVHESRTESELSS